jgi:hypothetical protein
MKYYMLVMHVVILRSYSREQYSLVLHRNLTKKITFFNFTFKIQIVKKHFFLSSFLQGFRGTLKL